MAPVVPIETRYIIGKTSQFPLPPVRCTPSANRCETQLPDRNRAHRQAQTNFRWGVDAWLRTGEGTSYCSDRHRVLPPGRHEVALANRQTYSGCIPEAP